MATTTTDLRRPLFPTFVWGFILFCFFGLLAVVAVRYFGTFETYESRRAAERLENLKKHREQMSSNLGTLAWADKEARTVQVPIDVAMGIATKNLNRKKVSPSAVSIVPPESAEAVTDKAVSNEAPGEETVPETTEPAPASGAAEQPQPTSQE